MKSPQRLLFSRLNSPSTFSLCLQRGGTALVFCVLPPDLLQVNAIPLLKIPELDAALQVRSHQDEREGQNSLLALLPKLLWMCPMTGLTFWALIIHQHLHILLQQSCSQSVNPTAFVDTGIQ